MVYQTSELNVAAYLRLRGFALKKLDPRRDNPRRFVFVFDDPDSTALGVAKEFFNTPFAEYDNHVRTLKKQSYIATVGD